MRMLANYLHSHRPNWCWLVVIRWQRYQCPGRADHFASFSISGNSAISTTASALAINLIGYYNPANVGVLPAPYNWWQAAGMWAGHAGLLALYRRCAIQRPSRPRHNIPSRSRRRLYGTVHPSKNAPSVTADSTDQHRETTTKPGGVSPPCLLPSMASPAQLARRPGSRSHKICFPICMTVGTRHPATAAQVADLGLRGRL